MFFLPMRGLRNPASAFLSIAAGIGTRFMSERLGADTPIIRCMPNTPAAIGKGMLVYWKNAHVSAGCEDFVKIAADRQRAAWRGLRTRP